MLILSRKLNEGTIITMPDGRRAAIVIVSIDRGKVRLGIKVDKDVAVNRREVQDAIDGVQQLSRAS